MSGPTPKMKSKRGYSNILEMTGNRLMEMGFEIFCAGDGEHSSFFIFFPHMEGVKSQATFDGFLSFPKLLRLKFLPFPAQTGVPP